MYFILQNVKFRENEFMIALMMKSFYMYFNNIKIKMNNFILQSVVFMKLHNNELLAFIQNELRCSADHLYIIIPFVHHHL
jgi:hypothetical protein